MEGKGAGRMALCGLVLKFNSGLFCTLGLLLVVGSWRQQQQGQAGGGGGGGQVGEVQGEEEGIQ